MSRALWVMTTVTYGALLICTWGLTSLVRDEDVVSYSDAGPLLGPAMALAATLVVGAWLRASRRGGAWLTGVGAAASTWITLVAAAALGYTVTRGQFAWLLLVAAHYATSAFTLIPAVIAGVLVGMVAALMPRVRRASFAPDHPEG